MNLEVELNHELRVSNETIESLISLKHELWVWYEINEPIIILKREFKGIE